MGHPLWQCGFIRGPVSAELEAELRDASPGSFIVRLSTSNGGELVITYQSSRSKNGLASVLVRIQKSGFSVADQYYKTFNEIIESKSEKFKFIFPNKPVSDFSEQLNVKKGKSPIAALGDGSSRVTCAYFEDL